MASLTELALVHTGLDGPRLAHLHRLVASWGPLSDLSFADLLLCIPLRGGEAPGASTRFVVVAHVRPTTNQTVYRQDFVGQVVDEVERPLVARAFALQEMVEGEVHVSALHDRVRVLAIPVRWDDEVIAVLTRESAPNIGRMFGELERTYMEVFDRFAAMIAAGTFPFAAEDTESEESPRVGDGVILLGPDARVEYASPNAVSALHRIGVVASVESMSLADLGLGDTGVPASLAMGVPVTEEVERGNEITLLVRCIPLLEPGVKGAAWVSGALVLMRDVSELRRRDRLLLSMDATIREIHHRVKNNLQTISSLLGLQGRRVSSPEAKTAIEESVRRIRAIALVHETLSRGPGDDVSFTDVVRPLVRVVEEGLLSPERPIRFHLEGESGLLPARVATPLALVLTELLQNVVDHAFPFDPFGGAEAGEPAGPVGPVVDGNVWVHFGRDRGDLVVHVIDDGLGLPKGFDLARSTNLGLSIVRTLVTTELGGTLRMWTDDERPAEGRPGTVAELRMPLGGRGAGGLQPQN